MLLNRPRTRSTRSRSLLRHALLAVMVMVTVLAAGCVSPQTKPREAHEAYRIETIGGNGSTGVVSHAGGPARELPVDHPFGVERGPGDALLVTTARGNQVLRLDRRSGLLVPVAGTGQRGYSGDGGSATNAMLNQPYEVRFDSRGNLLILEMGNHLLRRVDARSGIISTLAGDGVSGFRGDGGPARAARFRSPHSMTVDKRDNIYVADIGNHRVRRIDARSGRIETIVGNGETGLPEEGGKVSAQPFRAPQGLAVRGNNLWVASYSGHCIWRVDLKTGLLHRVAGTGRQGFSGDGGHALDATFDGPRGIVLGPSGILYVADGENNAIRAIDTARGTIHTIAGSGRGHSVYQGDGMTATSATLGEPHGVCVFKDGALAVSDTLNHRVRLLAPASDSR